MFMSKEEKMRCKQRKRIDAIKIDETIFFPEEKKEKSDKGPHTENETRIEKEGYPEIEEKPTEDNTKRKDIFSWLKVGNNSLSNIKRMLRAKIIELLGDREIHELLQEKYKQYETDKMNSKKEINQNPNKRNDNSKCNLNNYKIYVQSEDINNYREKEIKEKRDILQKTQKIINDKSSRMSKYASSWDEEKEKEYKERKGQSKKFLFDIVKSVKYIDCGFSNGIQKILNNDQVKDYRLQLLLKHMDGIVLTSSELKYLALTSETLNRFLDRKDYQQCTNILENEFIDDIEMCIAQEILDNYYDLKRMLMGERNKYLKGKVKDQKDIQYYKDIQLNRLYNGNSSTRVLNMKRQKLLKHSKDIQLMSSDHHAYFRNKRPETASLNRHNLDVDSYTYQRNTLYDSRMTKKQFIHKIHPSSKIIIDKTKHTVSDESGNQYRLPIETSKKEDKFRIKQTESHKLITKFDFVQSNSTGPFSRRGMFHKPTNLRIKACITIQRFARGYIARKNYRFGSDFRYKLMEIRRMRIKRHQGENFSSTSPVPHHRSKESTIHGSSLAEKKRKKVFFLENPEKDMNSVMKDKETRIAGLKVIQFARRNQWASLKSLNFVVLKSHVKITDEKGNTALFYAAINQNIEMCKYLLEKGSDPNIGCEDGNTPFHCAFLYGSNGMIRLFEKYNGDTKSRNNQGKFPQQMENEFSMKASTQRKMTERTINTTGDSTTNRIPKSETKIRLMNTKTSENIFDSYR